MQVFVGEEFGDNKLELKRNIGEFVRRLYRPPRSPERFVDLKYTIKKSEDVDQNKGKFHIRVKVYHSEVSDSKYNIRHKYKKYEKAVKHNYLTWWDRYRLYGLKPDYKERKVNKL